MSYKTTVSTWLGTPAEIGSRPSNRVLLVGNFLSGPTGTRAICEDLCLRLRACGWSVLTTSNKLARLPRLCDMVSTAWSRRKEYSVAQVDVFSGPAFLWAEAVCWVLRRAGKPHLLILHGGNLPHFARRWPRRVRYLLNSGAIVTTPSRYLLETMKQYRHDLCLLPYALEISSYRFALRSLPRPRLVWLRAFHKIYNPALAAEVVALLTQEFPDVSLIMIGPDKDDGSLHAMQAMAEELGVSDRIELSGRVPKPKVSNWLNQGDVFLNTTNIDNTPVSVLEAMACGLCVVSTNVGGIPYLLEHERNALLVEPNDPKAMAAAVRRILVDHALAAKLSVNARKKAEEFDWLAVLPEWKAILNSI